MGVFIHYALHAECPEEELVARLRRLRTRLRKLPGVKVGKLRRLDPAFHRGYLRLLPEHGFRLPKAVQERLRGKWGLAYSELCQLAAPVAAVLIPEELEERFYQPAVEFLKTTRLWDEADLPEQVNVGSLTIFRKGFAFELAQAMLRYGYVLVADPGEGSETVGLGLTTMRGDGVPLWLGSGFTKTQYATHFTTAHENACRILDCVREEGLLLKANDTCGFYEHRDWRRSAPIVNAETTFAHAMGTMLSAACTEAQKKGADIQDMSDPATRNYNIVQVEDAPAGGSGRTSG